MSKPTSCLLLAILAVNTAPHAQAALYSYYIGTDSVATFTTGTFTGLANPNFNRLTLLYQHANLTAPYTGSHYHRLGAYALQGSASSPTVFFTNSRVPEGTNPALPLQPGSGAFAGKLISSPVVDPVLAEYSDLEIAPVWDLKSYNDNAILGEVEDVLWTSSSGRYTSSLAGSDPHFTLVSISPGLNAGDSTGTPLFVNPGDEHHLGDGNTFSNWTPWFWTDSSAAPGLYSATFKLTDEEGLFGDSGEFRYEFQVVPEPGSATLLGGLLALGAMRRRR